MSFSIDDWDTKLVPRPGDRNAMAEEVINNTDLRDLVESNRKSTGTTTRVE